MFEELKERLSEAWGSAPWELLAPSLAPVHEHLVRTLRPGPGVRWLDVATGTGALATLAARAGADVTGVDLAPKLIATARRLAEEEGQAIRFEPGDAEALAFADGAFDVVSSSMGLFLAPDHAAVARELGRVCRPGGRVGFTAWRKGACFFPLSRRYSPPLLPGQGDSESWGSEDYVRERLGDAFDLEFEEGDAPVAGESGEAIWELVRTASGPFKARVESLEPERREQFHGEFVDLVESYRTNGGVRLPAPYLLVLGTRR